MKEKMQGVFLSVFKSGMHFVMWLNCLLLGFYYGTGGQYPYDLQFFFIVCAGLLLIKILIYDVPEWKGRQTKKE